MNKAEKMIISEKFENVVMAIPDTKSETYVLAQQVKAFRELIKAL